MLEVFIVAFFVSEPARRFYILLLLLGVLGFCIRFRWHGFPAVGKGTCL